jgi:cytidylate kinase
MIVTIDGPAGSGKSTAAQELARMLDLAYLDTGAMYRAVTLKALREGVDLTDEQAMRDCARRADIRLVPDHVALRVLLDGEDVSDAIRTAEVTDNARYAACCPPVREIMVDLQRRVGRQLGSFVTEGRDQGSVVFPDADVKIYLTAPAVVRARRRAAEMAARGEPADVEAIREKLIARDRSDRERTVGPLVRPEGAIEVDTGERTIEQTAEMLRAVVLEHV